MSIIDYSRRRSYLHLKASKATTKNHSLFFEVSYPLASIVGFFSAADTDYRIRARMSIDGHYSYTLSFFNFSQLVLPPLDLSYVDFTCHNKEDLSNTSFFNRRQSNFPIENQRTIYTLGFQLPNTLPEAVMDPAFADQDDRRAIGAYIKVQVDGYRLVSGGLYYTSHNSYLRGDVKVDINDCTLPCQEFVGFYAFEELLKEKLIQFRLELLNPAYAAAPVETPLTADCQQSVDHC